MMKNNPFLTVILLFCIQVLLIKYLDYIDFEMGEDLSLAFMCFLVPVVCIILNMFIETSSYKKLFKYFTISIVIISILAFVVLTFLGALGRSFNH